MKTNQRHVRENSLSVGRYKLLGVLAIWPCPVNDSTKSPPVIATSCVNTVTCKNIQKDWIIQYYYSLVRGDIPLIVNLGRTGFNAL